MGWPSLLAGVGRPTRTLPTAWQRCLGTGCRVGEAHAHWRAQPALLLRDVRRSCCREGPQRRLGRPDSLAGSSASNRSSLLLSVSLWNGVLAYAGNAAWAVQADLAKLTPIGQPSLLFDADRPDSHPPDGLATLPGPLQQLWRSPRPLVGPVGYLAQAVPTRTPVPTTLYAAGSGSTTRAALRAADMVAGRPASNLGGGVLVPSPGLLAGPSVL